MKNILIVDDDPDLLSSLRELLQRRLTAVTVDIAHSRDAGEHLAAHPYDLSIIDWMLPHKGGLEVITQTHAMQPTCPIILITASIEPRLGDMTRGLRLFAVVEKPFKGDELVALVQAALSQGCVDHRSHIPASLNRSRTGP